MTRLIVRDIAADLDCMDGVIAELISRKVEGKPLTYKWFRRVCKRNNISSTEARKYLFEICVIDDRWNPTLITCNVAWRTYEGWREIGYQVMKGQTSWAKSEGVPVFHSLQVFEVLS